jgi:hypothetical protein
VADGSDKLALVMHTNGPRELASPLELTPIDRVRIRLVSRFGEATIERWYSNPDSVRESTDDALRLACAAIGVTMPRPRKAP